MNRWRSSVLTSDAGLSRSGKGNNQFLNGQGMSDQNTKDATSGVDLGLFDLVPFSVDLDALCGPLILGPRQYEYANELKGPWYFSAPTHMLPDGHPRKPKRQIGVRSRQVRNIAIVRD